ncbi:OmpA family protein [Psychrobacter aestuarii]|uniref:OmpA family protein n=1 Tax=Psychrobacter aestuarii TaxID=556327 RepID=A0ABP3FBF0_9GAMM|nr:OmpA family protein [Psychrobacter aestuarii]
MDIISHLTRTVTPAVISDEAHTHEHANMLEAFYAIFAARLADEGTYNQLAHDNIALDDKSLVSRIWTDKAQQEQITEELASHHHLEKEETRALTAAAAPLAYHELHSLAGATPVPEFLHNNHSRYEPHIPLWASALLPAATVAAVHDAEPVSAAPIGNENAREGSFMKALLPIVGLIILSALAWALLKGCQTDPEPVGMPMQSEQSAETAADTADGAAADSTAQNAVAMPVPASLRIATGTGSSLYACRINVGDAALQSAIIDEVGNVFGDEVGRCQADVDDYYATDMPAAEQLMSVLPIIKSVPNATMLIEGDTITINAPDQAALDKMIADVQSVAPAMRVIAAPPLDVDAAVAESIDASSTALDNLSEPPNPRDVARALSMQVINFAVDEAKIPDANKPLLDRAVALMQQVPTMSLMIIGHTDKQASASYNMQLSEKRAQAVKDYMVAQGADASRLMTKGMGETDPVADNATEQGRFRNRRIEFTIYDSAMSEGNGVSLTAGDSGDVNMQNNSLDTSDSTSAQ